MQPEGRHIEYSCDQDFWKGGEGEPGAAIESDLKLNSTAFQMKNDLRQEDLK